MRRLGRIALLSLTIFFPLHFSAAEVHPSLNGLDRAVSIEESDGSPSVLDCRRVYVSNGTLTDNADGTVTLATGSGGGNSVYIDSNGVPVVDSSAADININFGSDFGISTSGQNITIDADTISVDSAITSDSEINAPSMQNSDGDLLLQQYGAGNIESFRDGSVGDSDDGLIFRIWRNAPEGTSSMVWYVDASETGVITTANDAGLVVKAGAGYFNTRSGAGQSWYADCGDTFTFRDIDDTYATKVTIASDTGNIDTIGTIQAGSGNITITDATGNLDGSKVANADLGDIDTSGGVWTIEPEFISGKTDVTSTDSDYILIWDATDSALKKVDMGEVRGGAAGGATYREITLLPESAVLDDNSPATLSIVESTGTSTPRFRVAQFDDNEDDKLYWTFVMPSDATASQDLILDIYSYSDEDADENVVWAVQVSATSDNDGDNMTEQAADTADTATENYNKAEAYALCVVSLTIDYANCDGAVAGDTVTLCFYRDGDNGSDDHTNEVYLHSCHLKIPRS